MMVSSRHTDLPTHQAAAHDRSGTELGPYDTDLAYLADHFEVWLWVGLCSVARRG